MSQPWTYMNRRYGSEVSAPTKEQIQEAVSELFHENLPNMTEADYEEHGAASLRFGYDEGPMYELSITRTGMASLDVWQDQDYKVEAKPSRMISRISEAKAVDLWSLLASGNLPQVEAVFDENKNA